MRSERRIESESGVPVPEQAIVRLPGGGRGLRVTLRYVPRIMEATRKERLLILRDIFLKVSTQLADDGGQLRDDTLLVSRQTCQAVLPLEKYEVLKTRLARRRIRVEHLFDWKH